MGIVEYLQSRIEKCTDKRIEFVEGDRVGKDPDKLVEWVTKNFIHIYPHIGEDAKLQPEALKQKVIDNFLNILQPFKPKSVEVEVLDGGDIMAEIQKTEDNFDSLIPIMNIESNDNKKLFNMYDNKERRFSVITFSAWEKRLGAKNVAPLLQSAYPMIVRYVPNTLESIIPPDYNKDGPEGKYVCLNTYIPPKFKLNEIPTPEVPELLLGFLKHLFVNENCYNYMMESVYYVLNNRLQVVPVLNGRTGIGKGIFTEHLIANLVGPTNSIIAPISWDKSGFNAWLSNKQFIIFDEAKIVSHGNDQNVDVIKRLMNDMLNIEKKGVDADSLTQNYASFFITANNGAKRFKLELDNRRFAPCDLTEEKVEKKYSQKEVEELIRLVNDKETIANVYWWVQKNWNPAKTNPKRTPHTILQCEALYKFQFESLNLWQRGIVEILLTQELNKYTFSQVNKSYRQVYSRITGKETNTKRSIDLADAKDFIQSYRHYGDKEPMGYFETGADDLPVLVANENYKSKHGAYKEVGTGEDIDISML